MLLTSRFAAASGLAGDECWQRQRRLTAKLVSSMLLAGVIFVLSGGSPVRAEEPRTTSAGSAVRGAAAAAALEQAIFSALAVGEPSVVAIARVAEPDPSDEAPGGSLLTPSALAARSVQPTDPDFMPNEYGAGVVIDAEGLILTNYHLLGNPQKSRFYVWTQKRPFPAKIFAADPWYDLAVLRIDATDLKPIEFAKGEEARKGQIVLALGNPLAIARDGDPSVAWGIIANVLRKAAPGRSTGNFDGKGTVHHFGTLIQTDAKLSFGFSGGALLDLNGQMVGLTTSWTGGVGYESAAGFAIPTDAGFRRVVGDLRAGRKPEHGFLGIAPESNRLALRQRGIWGARVVEVYPGTPAARAGFEDGDLIVKIDGQPIHAPHDVVRIVGALAPGDVAEVGLVRASLSDRQLAGAGDRPEFVEVRLAKKPQSSPYPTLGTDPIRAWRGIRVDYLTASPDFRDLIGRLGPQSGVLVVNVVEESPGWMAGLRSGDLISHAEGRPVETPKEFLRRVASATSPVKLRVVAGRGTTQLRTVAASEEAQ